MNNPISEMISGNFSFQIEVKIIANNVLQMFTGKITHCIFVFAYLRIAKQY